MNAGFVLVEWFGHTCVKVQGDRVGTTLPDGTVIDALPNHGDEDVARAHSLGYGGDVLAMTRDHDRMHARLAHALGLKESPALRDAALARTTEIGDAEEAMVLAAQRFLNLCRREGLL